MQIEHLSEYKHIVRIIGNDIPGEKKMVVGLTQIRGIGQMFANALLDVLKINRNDNIGYLSDEQVQLIEKTIKDPASANFPTWFLNRRKDITSGEDMHLITSDIALTIRNDIERERLLNSWRGYRHMFGLKVRGQRTRCTGRKGGAVGVKKGGKVLPPGAAGAPAAEGAEAVPAAGEKAVPAAGEKAVPAAGEKAVPAAGEKAAPAAEKK